MDIAFISPEFEHLKTPYYEDFFFQHVEVIDEATEKVFMSSDFQGKFLLSVWEVLIDFENGKTIEKVKQFGKMNFYTFCYVAGDIQIEQNGKVTISLAYEEFYQAYYEATKSFLNFIKRENPRIVLEDHFQQLSANCSYYERKLALNEQPL